MFVWTTITASHHDSSLQPHEDPAKIGEVFTSTSGIYMGMQIDNKRLDEGDVFHQLRFTYRAD